MFSTQSFDALEANLMALVRIVDDLQTDARALQTVVKQQDETIHSLDAQLHEILELQNVIDNHQDMLIAQAETNKSIAEGIDSLTAIIANQHETIESLLQAVAKLESANVTGSGLPD